jgi:outer membrane receptor for ferrienterochelin and colicin/copper chaperone CopZ
MISKIQITLFIIFSFSIVLTAQQSNTFKVGGVCGMCEERIEEAALGKGKASSAEWNMESGMLEVEFDKNKTSLKKIKKAIAAVGHDTDEIKAKEEVYEQLHACCKYRAAEAYGATLENDMEGLIYTRFNGKKEPLIGAYVIFDGRSEGTTTAEDGYFRLENPNEHDRVLRISFIGHEDVTLEIDDFGFVEIVLKEGNVLEAVEVTYEQKATEVSLLNPANLVTLTNKELTKAACCNLSGSFETNPSIDMSYPDAVTGTRQIRMLGLAGPYVQVTRELIPDVRAMSSVYGMKMTPGPWIESIQLIKGIGSVTNGFESIAGQINVELKKPDMGERLFVNGYANIEGSTELNFNTRYELNENISTALLAHGKLMQRAHDGNDDGFTDMPRSKDYILANRWKFVGDKGFRGQLGVKFSALDHQAGELASFDEPNSEQFWKMDNQSTRLEAWAKTAYISQKNPDNSIGLQMSAVKHEQNAIYGNEKYENDQNSFYSNLVVQVKPGLSHSIKAGLSLTVDNIEENTERLETQLIREEVIPGVFAEYTYDKSGKLSIIPGLRVDHHNNYGTIFSPRIHAKYNFTEKSILRFVAGKGFRTASILAENPGIFSSSRQIILPETSNDNPYGLDAEIAWNYGINLTHKLDLSGNEVILSLDLYRTDFENQIVVDYETPTQVSFYNLDGKSFSNSLQAKIDYELFDGFNVRAAYRMFDVQTDYQSGLKEKPLVSRHRAFINLAYEPNGNWAFDATANWNGKKRLPDTSSNPAEYRRPEFSEDYYLVNAQISRYFGDSWDVYLGVENLFNYSQKDPIIAQDDPFGPHFDASIVWAPIFGSNYYLGFRYRLK